MIRRPPRSTPFPTRRSSDLQSDRSALKVGSSGGRSSKTSTVIRTANTPSENALSRSGVALWSTPRPVVNSEPQLLTPPSVPGSLGHADAESFQKTVLPRRGDDHSVAVLHPFGPAQIETTLGEGGAYRARDVWPSFGPVEA